MGQPAATQPECPYPLDRCKSCDAPIFWAVAEVSLKSLPIDPQPAPNGNLQIIDKDRRPPIVRSLRVAERFAKKGLYITHFVTCPFADQHCTRRARRLPS
jgi:hypothetical protein